MSKPDVDSAFIGSVPDIYEKYLVPLIFESYAIDLANRLAARPVSCVLEIAAGTGVLTRALSSILPDGVAIIATDLNQPMLDQASARGTKGPVEWRQADAMQLPFGDDTFDAVACQFGVMFFPDKPKAIAEAHRVLKPGGMFIFNVWDRIEDNEFADVVTTSLESVFPKDPPRFLARTPHGYSDPELLAWDLEAGGFARSPEITLVAGRSRAASPRDPAIAYCLGTPLRNEIEALNPALLGEATDVAAEAIARRFGRGPVDAGMLAYVVVVVK